MGNDKKQTESSRCRIPSSVSTYCFPGEPVTSRKGWMATGEDQWRWRDRWQPGTDWCGVHWISSPVCSPCERAPINKLQHPMTINTPRVSREGGGWETHYAWRNGNNIGTPNGHETICANNSIRWTSGSEMRLRKCGRVVFPAIELIIYFLISFIMKLLVTALHNKVTPKINFLLHYLVIYSHGNICHVVLYFTEYWYLLCINLCIV